MRRNVEGRRASVERENGSRARVERNPNSQVPNTREITNTKVPNTDTQTPKTMLQTPKKSQAPNPNSPRAVAALELGVWNFSGVWSLVFGVFVLVFGAFIRPCVGSRFD